MFGFVVLTAILLKAGANHNAGPIIVQSPKNMTVAPGSQFKLECKAEGGPATKITITRLEEAELNEAESRGNDVDVEPCAKEVIYMNEEVYTQDEGWYRCVAANSRGVVFADAYLRVYDLCEDITCAGGKICVPDNEAATASCVCPECVDLTYNPFCGSDCVSHFNYCQLELQNCRHGTSYTRFLDGSFCPHFSPPEFIETPPRVVNVVEGKAFTLTCKVDPAGKSPGPPPIISWYIANYEAPTLDDENPTLYGPDYGQKLGDGETIVLRTEDNYDVFCVAHQCKDSGNKATDTVSHQVTVELGPAVCFNEWRGGPSCQVFGDPHIITFDNVVYEFEGHCEYVLAMDCEEKKWSVYGSFETCSTHGRGACLSSLTLNYNEETTIELGRGMGVKIDGKDFDVQGIERITTDSNETLYIFEKDDWLIIQFKLAEGNTSHYEVRWDGLMSAQILLGSNHTTSCGLCGNANNDTSDEFQVKRTGKVTSNAARFGDSWRVDKANECEKSSDLPWWKWRREFADRKDDAIMTCDKMFESPQIADCANGVRGLAPVDPKPYKDACIADYMRSDFLADDASGLNMACVAVQNYAVRCDNMGKKVHLWREETGCAGGEEELIEFMKFIREFKSDF